MLIPNPWRHHPMVRYTCKTPDGDITVVRASREGLEVEDNVNEAMVEPVKASGRGGAVTVVGQGRIWSRAWGLLEVKDHVKKMELIAQEEKLTKKQEADRKREAKKAKERAVTAKPVEVVNKIRMVHSPQPEKRGGKS